MVWPFQTQHEQNVHFKRKQRSERINALKEYHKPLTPQEEQIIKYKVEEVVKKVQSGEFTPLDVLKGYGKKTLEVQAKTNAVTEVMIKEAETWASKANTDGPLAGFPISLKDSFEVGGFDALAGYSILANKPAREDGATVKIIKAAGGYPYVKTNVPVTMMTIDGYNDIWGRTVNPHNPNYAPGGSSQGEGALIGGGGSRIGIGTDIGGSVRVPAAWSGLYSLRMTSLRFPFDGDSSCDDGFDSIQAVASPMARTLQDLRYFIESVFSVKPWKYDFHLIPLPWRSDAKLPNGPRVGVLQFDELLPLTPAQQRALMTVADALRKQGCQVIDFKLPVPAREYHRNIFSLFQASGFLALSDVLMKGEHNDPYVQSVMSYARLPRFIQKLWELLLRLFGYSEYADIYSCRKLQTTLENEKNIAKRQQLRRAFREAWDSQGLDFMISAPHPSPALPNGAPNSVHTILYTALFNMLDYPAGIVPVDRVDSTIDRLPAAFDTSKFTYCGKLSFETYDAEKMAGLPTAVQVVGMHHQDEETLAAMELVESSLREIGVQFQ